MLNRLMISAATAALIAGTGLANAQGNMSREAPSGGMQQNTPASPTTAAPSREGSEGVKSTQSDEKGAVKNPHAQQDVKPGPKGEKSNSMSTQNEKSVPGKDMKAESHDERNGNMKAETRDGSPPTGSKEGRTQTVGQAGAAAKLNTEQRTKITTVIREQHVAPATNINFSISLGTRVPREVGFHPLPAEIVTIYPEWRGYEFFLVREQIVVVDPRTLEIVAVLDV